MVGLALGVRTDSEVEIVSQEILGNYGWKTTDATEAHNYLWPAIKFQLPSVNALRVLDLGCGNGYVAGNLAELGHEVVGVDASADGIQLAASRYPRVKFLVASVYDDLTKLVPAEFDLVVSSEVIEHLYYPRRLLKTAQEMLRPGGEIIVTTPYHGYLKNLALSLANKWDDHHTVLWDGGHIKFFSRKTLSLLFREAGFVNARFLGAGRIPFLWKSMLFRAQRPAL